MKLLLDTHIFLWSIQQPERMAPAMRAAIEDPSNDVFLSTASTWEIAIKYAVGKLSLPTAPASFLPPHIASARFRVLAISLEHSLAVAGLPSHHSDPFDRLLIAQALLDDLTIVTIDFAFKKYGANLLQADSESEPEEPPAG